MACEAVRRERNGQVTLIGVHPGMVRVNKFPTTIPSLAFFIQLRLPVARTLSEVRLRIKRPGQDDQWSTVTRGSTGFPQREGGPETRLVVHYLSLTSVNVPEPTVYQLSIVEDDAELEIGYLALVQARPAVGTRFLEKAMAYVAYYAKQEDKERPQLASEMLADLVRNLPPSARASDVVLPLDPENGRYRLLHKEASDAPEAVEFTTIQGLPEGVVGHIEAVNRLGAIIRIEPPTVAITGVEMTLANEPAASKSSRVEPISTQAGKKKSRVRPSRLE